MCSEDPCMTCRPRSGDRLRYPIGSRWQIGPSALAAYRGSSPRRRNVARKTHPGGLSGIERCHLLEPCSWRDLLVPFCRRFGEESP